MTRVVSCIESFGFSRWGSKVHDMTGLKQRSLVKTMASSAIGAPTIVAGSDRGYPFGSGAVLAVCEFLVYAGKRLVLVSPNAARTEHCFDLLIPLAAGTSPNNGK